MFLRSWIPLRRELNGLAGLPGKVGRWVCLFRVFEARDELDEAALADPGAVVPIDHPHRRAAVFGDLERVLAVAERRGDERVPGRVELPRPHLRRRADPRPIVHRPEVVADPVALGVEEEEVVGLLVKRAGDLTQHLEDRVTAMKSGAPAPVVYQRRIRSRGIEI
jgi:hypothetical protein